MEGSHKVITIEEAALQRSQKEGQWVFTNGCFDLLHYGHISYLKEAKKLGDFLIVGINSDRSVHEIKGTERPIKDQFQRCQIMAALEMVDMVVLFDQPTPLQLIEAIKPDILVKGGDYNIDTIVGAEFVKKNGGQVIALSFLEEYSTSAFIDKIKKICQ